MFRPVVHGPAIASAVLVIGQAPGPREGKFGRPFAWTAGKTLFKWFERAIGADEAVTRDRVYFAAVARCFPGKAKPKAGGDRRPDPDEIARCEPYLVREVAILQPELVIPVGTLAIERVLGDKFKLDDVVGRLLAVRYHGRDVNVIALPHPSGASSWHKTKHGKLLLGRALRQLTAHPAMQRAFQTGHHSATNEPSP